MGRAVETVDSGGQVVVLSHRRHAKRDHRTIFGKVEVRRLGYSLPGQPQLCPLDEMLHLQERSFSYNLQYLAIVEAVKGPYAEGVDTVQRFTKVKMPKRTLEDLVKEAAVDFKSFYEQRTPPDPAETSSILVASADGKGIPLWKPRLEPERAGAPVERQKGVKQMATVAAVYTIAPRIRTPEQVTESLFKDPATPRLVTSDGVRVHNREPRPEHKRVWARLKGGKDAVFKELAAEAERRDLYRTKIRVALSDGEKALLRRFPHYLPTFLLILDLLHVLEKLWKAAGLLVGKGNKLKAKREEWVRPHVLSILQGNVTDVVLTIRQRAADKKVKGKKAKKLANICNYLERNSDHMRYHEYLAAGLPIASGIIEGACKNLIKTRFERPGMRWKATTGTPEAMLQMRAIYLSDDLEEYWAYHIRQEQARLYGKRRWTAVA